MHKTLLHYKTIIFINTWMNYVTRQGIIWFPITITTSTINMKAIKSILCTNYSIKRERINGRLLFSEWIHTEHNSKNPKQITHMMYYWILDIIFLTGLENKCLWIFTEIVPLSHFRTSSGCMCFSSEAQGTWSSYNLSGLAAGPPLAAPSRSQHEE